MLKKIFSYIIIFCLIFSVISCKKETESSIKKAESTAVNTNQETLDKAHNSDPLPAEADQKHSPLNKKQLLGISRDSLLEAFSDNWGIKLSVKNITPTRLTLLLEQDQGEPKGELETGSFYILEKFKNGNWTKLEPIIPQEQAGFTDEALQILPAQITEYNIDWSSLYGTLESGSYRIGKQISDFRSTDDFDQKMYYAAFDLVEADSNTKISYEHNGFELRLPYVPGFEYSVKEFTDEVMLLGTGEYFNISFRPLNEQGEIIFSYYKNFGLCGTGLETKEYGEGQMVVYDENPDWDFIIYPASEGFFVVTNHSSGEWLNTYQEQIMQIIDQTEKIDPGE